MSRRDDSPGLGMEGGVVRYQHQKNCRRRFSTFAFSLSYWPTSRRDETKRNCHVVPLNRGLPAQAREDFSRNFSFSRSSTPVTVPVGCQRRNVTPHSISSMLLIDGITSSPTETPSARNSSAEFPVLIDGNSDVLGDLRRIQGCHRPALLRRRTVFGLPQLRCWLRKKGEANTTKWASITSSAVLSARYLLISLAQRGRVMRTDPQGQPSKPNLSDKALHEQQDWLRVTLSSIGDAVITTDASGNVTFLNPVAESLTGWSLNEASGVPLDAVFKIVNEETRQTVENPATRALREGLVVGLANHTLLIAKDGTERPIDDSAAPIRNRQGEIARCRPGLPRHQ